MAKQEGKCLVVVRVRGISDIFREIKDTLKMLHLTRSCHATLIANRPSYIGMLKKVKDYVAWGEVSKETIALLLRERGKIIGDKKLTDEYAKKNGYKSLDDLADALYSLKAEYASLPDVKPIFRLHPPRKGFKGKVKKSYAAGGVTGYRGEAINTLIENMT